jgi:ATP-dependent protease HslVU (ClpYQ) peptidase subunit
VTTIAVSKRAIAWDSRLTIGDEKIDSPRDKVIVHDGVIYASAGDVFDMQHLIAFIKDPKANKAPKGEWEALFINKKGVFWLSDATTFPIQRLAPIALGSGGQFALGAMIAGANAVKAVEIASQCDSKTGGPIYYYNIADVTRGRKCR